MLDGIMGLMELFVRSVLIGKMIKFQNLENALDVKSSIQNMDGGKKRKVQSVQHVITVNALKNQEVDSDPYARPQNQMVGN